MGRTQAAKGANEMILAPFLLVRLKFRILLCRRIRVLILRCRCVGSRGAADGQLHLHAFFLCHRQSEVRSRNLLISQLSFHDLLDENRNRTHQGAKGHISMHSGLVELRLSHSTWVGSTRLERGRGRRTCPPFPDRVVGEQSFVWQICEWPPSMIQDHSSKSRCPCPVCFK